MDNFDTKYREEGGQAKIFRTAPHGWKMQFSLIPAFGTGAGLKKEVKRGYLKFELLKIYLSS